MPAFWFRGIGRNRRAFVGTLTLIAASRVLFHLFQLTFDNPTWTARFIITVRLGLASALVCALWFASGVALLRREPLGAMAAGVPIFVAYTVPDLPFPMLALLLFCSVATLASERGRPIFVVSEAALGFALPAFIIAGIAIPSFEHSFLLAYHSSWGALGLAVLCLGTFFFARRKLLSLPCFGFCAMLALLPDYGGFPLFQGCYGAAGPPPDSVINAMASHFVRAAGWALVLATATHLPSALGIDMTRARGDIARRSRRWTFRT